MVGSIFTILTETLARKHEFYVASFGTFLVRERPSRIGTQTTDQEKRFVVIFRPSRALKARIENTSAAPRQ